MSELFFINVQNPKEVRRYLLETSQQVLEGMKSYEKYKRTKAQKFEKIEELKQTTEKIRTLARELKGYFPEVPGAPKAPKKGISHATEIEFEQLNDEIKKLEEELRVLG